MCTSAGMYKHQRNIIEKEKVFFNGTSKRSRDSAVKEKSFYMTARVKKDGLQALSLYDFSRHR